MVKKFYKQATLHQGSNGLWGILLDNNTLSTPLRTPLALNTQSIAQTICDEWNAQDKQIKPDTMPVYSIMVTAIDKSSEDDRTAIISELTPYIDGDLLFYPAPEPHGLVEYQSQLWGHALQEFEREFHVKPDTTYDLIALKQSKKYHSAIIDFIQSLNTLKFTVFHVLVSLTGSPVLAALAIQNKLTADGLLKIINSESDFYHRHYKFKDEDISPEEKRKSIALQRDISACLCILDAK